MGLLYLYLYVIVIHNDTRTTKCQTLSCLSNDTHFKSCILFPFVGFFLKAICKRQVNQVPTLELQIKFHSKVDLRLSSVFLCIRLSEKRKQSRWLNRRTCIFCSRMRLEGRKDVQATSKCRYIYLPKHGVTCYMTINFISPWEP
jgi:hypothetical protein